MFLIMGISFYTTRIVLKYLGVADFGIYNVIGGLVSMFAVFTSALTGAISRFLTYEIGRDDIKNLTETFSSSITIISIIILIFIIIIEPLGIWFLNHKMQIADERLESAHWVFQCSIITFAIGLLSIPYNALIVAHEHMKAFAYISLVEATLKLGIAYLLSIHFMDSLKLYAILLTLVAITIRYIYANYASRHFCEAYFKLNFNKQKFKDILAFTGWTCIGGSASILSNQGINLLLNVYFGTVVNAARGIAIQVNAAVTNFSTNFMVATNPQIIKSYASNEKIRTEYLVFQGSRFAFFLMLIIAVPLIVETNEILEIWLTTVPPETEIFIRLTICQSMIEAMCLSLQTLNQASGMIKIYQIVAGGVLMLNFPLSWLALECGMSAQSVYYIALIISVAGIISRSVVLYKTTGFKASRFMIDVVLKNIVIASLSISIPYVVSLLLQQSFVSVIIISLISIIWTAIIVFFIGLKASERNLIIEKITLILLKR